MSGRPRRGAAVDSTSKAPSSNAHCGWKPDSRPAASANGAARTRLAAASDRGQATSVGAGDASNASAGRQTCSAARGDRPSLADVVRQGGAAASQRAKRALPAGFAPSAANRPRRSAATAPSGTAAASGSCAAPRAAGKRRAAPASAAAAASQAAPQARRQRLAASASPRSPADDLSGDEFDEAAEEAGYEQPDPLSADRRDDDADDDAAALSVRLGDSSDLPSGPSESDSPDRQQARIAAMLRGELSEHDATDDEASDDEHEGEGGGSGGATQVKQRPPWQRLPKSELEPALEPWPSGMKLIALDVRTTGGAVPRIISLASAVVQAGGAPAASSSRAPPRRRFQAEARAAGHGGAANADQDVRASHSLTAIPSPLPVLADFVYAILMTACAHTGQVAGAIAQDPPPFHEYVQTNAPVEAAIVRDTHGLGFSELQGQAVGDIGSVLGRWLQWLSDEVGLETAAALVAWGALGSRGSGQFDVLFAELERLEKDLPAGPTWYVLDLEVAAQRSKAYASVAAAEWPTRTPKDAPRLSLVDAAAFSRRTDPRLEVTEVRKHEQLFALGAVAGNLQLCVVGRKVGLALPTKPLTEWATGFVEWERGREVDEPPAPWNEVKEGDAPPVEQPEGPGFTGRQGGPSEELKRAVGLSEVSLLGSGSGSESGSAGGWCYG